MQKNTVNKGNRRYRGGLTTSLSRRVKGQPAAIDAIVPYVEMYAAGLAPFGRPAGVFLLLGPTGTGKTKTVEALADVLHGSESKLLRIDCGEFQLEHESAKLIGAPPGYLGHRETHPMISQQNLTETTSERCGLSIVLLDEIEKAAPSLGRLLLGVLDKAELHLGDNTTVNFQNSLIFMTSNLGASEMARLMNPGFGYESVRGGSEKDFGGKLERIGVNAVKKQFSPEFVNRIDAVVTYRPLGQDALRAIIEQQLAEVQAQLNARLGTRAFGLEVDEAAKGFLLAKGTNTEYGARELKRTTHRHLLQPLAAMMVRGQVSLGGVVRVSHEETNDELSFRSALPSAIRKKAGETVELFATLQRMRRLEQVRRDAADIVELSA